MNLASTSVSPEAMLARRRLARWMAIAVHVLGVLVPGFLMLTTEGPGASVNGAANVTHARINLAVIVAFAVAQAVALLVWRRRSRAVRAAAAAGPDPSLTQVTSSRQWARNRAVDKGAVKVCFGLVFAAAWIAQIGYVAQALASMGDGGYSEQTSGLTIGMIVIGVVLALVGAMTGGFALLSVRTGDAAARDLAIAMGAPAPGYGNAATGPAPGQPGGGPRTGARIAALSRMRRRATRYLVGSVILMVALAVLAAVAAATGQWSLHFTLMVPALFLISLSRAALSVKARRATARAIQRLSDEERAQPVPGYRPAGHGPAAYDPAGYASAGYGQPGVPPGRTGPEWTPGPPW
jgi:hypothetical protein